MSAAPSPLATTRLSWPDSGWSARGVTIGATAGGLGLALTLLLGWRDPTAALHSYLVAFVYFLSLALGGLFFVLLQHLTRAGWSVTVRRLAEGVAWTLPLFALLFVPIALGIHELYHWSHAEAVARDPLLQHKAAYLNPGRFLLRAGLYFVVWSGLAWWLWSRSRRQDDSGDPAITRRLQSLSAPGMVLYAVTQTLASFDWIMSLDPHWFSTIFGVYFFSGSAVAIFAALIALPIALQRDGRLEGIVTFEHYHDLGKLLFGFTVFWAYIAFSQFMLIWYANIPEETAWFAHRWHGSWKAYSILLAVGHFAIPFLFLLLRDVKRNKATLFGAAAWLLVMHYFDLYWLVMPGHAPEGVHLTLADGTALVGVGGLFLAVLVRVLRDKPLVPLRDPRLREALAFENA